MRRAPSIVAILFALVACGTLGVLLTLELRRATPDASPRAAIADAARDRAQARTDAFAAADRTFDTAFDPAMVRKRVQWRANPADPLITDIAFVNATPGADLAAGARECAKQMGAKERTPVQCYAFANTETFESKDMMRGVETGDSVGIINLCWAARAATDRVGGPIDVADMRLAPQTWDAHGCPASWQGTAPAPQEASL